MMSRKIKSLLLLLLTIGISTMGIMMSLRYTSRSPEELHRTTGEEFIKDIRVLCWIMTAPENHWTKAIHVKNTWGKRCDTLLFVSSKNDTKLPAVAVIDGKEGRQFLWHKTQAAHKLMYEKYLDEADWFMRADDNSYVIVENLKFLLKDYDPKEPLYFGQRFKQLAKKGYMTGGAGFVLSKEALKRFVEKALPENPGNCPPNVFSEGDDVLIADCLVDVGVMIVDTRDALGRHRFNHWPPDKILNGAVPDWYPKFLYYPQQSGFNCCSEALISFHYVEPKDMYVLEYLIYHLKVFGMKKNNFSWNEIGRDISQTVALQDIII